MPTKTGDFRLRAAAIVASLAMSGGLAACAASTTPLPETGAIGKPLLTPQEQKQAIAELEERKRKLDAEAARQAQHQ